MSTKRPVKSNRIASQEFSVEALHPLFSEMVRFEKQLCLLLVQLLNLDDPEAIGQFMQMHPVLLSDEAVSFLTIMRKYYQSSSNRADIIDRHKDLLVNLRKASGSSDEIFDFLDMDGNIVSLNASTQIQKAVVLEQEAKVLLRNQEMGLALNAFVEMWTIFHDLGMGQEPDIVSAFDSWMTYYADLIMRHQLAGSIKDYSILSWAESTYNDAFVSTLNILASTYQAKLQYHLARRLYILALLVAKVRFGNKHPQTVASAQKLALLNREIGDYESAFGDIQEVLMDLPLVKDTSQIVTTLNVAALAFRDIGNLEWAAELIERSYAYIADDVEVATRSHLVGLFHLDRNEYAAAIPHLQQAISIFREKLGEVNLELSASFHLLSLAHRATGDFDSALFTAKQSTKIRSSILRVEHPEHIASFYTTASLMASTGNYQNAKILLQEAISFETGSIYAIFSASSERQRRAYARKIREHFQIALSLLLKIYPENASALTDITDLVISRKGIETDIGRAFYVLLSREVLHKELRTLGDLREEIANRSLSGSSLLYSKPDFPELILGTYHGQRELLEINLAVEMADAFKGELQKQLSSINHRDIIMQLQDNEALIEFIQFQSFDFDAVQASGDAQWLPSKYLAIIIRNVESQPVQIIDLGSAAEINRRVVEFRKAITSEADPYKYKSLDGSEDSRDRHLKLLPSESLDGDHLLEWGYKLREILFDPLSTAIGNCSNLLISPDGELARLPFETIPLNETEFLIDKFCISYLGNSRELLRTDDESDSVEKSVVVASPDYDMNPAIEFTEITNESEEILTATLRNSDVRFSPLPSTIQEGTMVAQLVNADTLFGIDALKSNLKALQSPRILHIATHGFFFSNQSPQDTGNHGAVSTPSGQDTNLEKLMQIENPLLRSGLALSGANVWLSGSATLDRVDNGLLTAEDVSTMELASTELVVLSACETGLGDIEVGEGVAGLRRAFMMAGAKTLVMSLWKVPDLQTKELMIDFYHRLRDGQPRAEALRRAQIAMKQRHLHPLYWGAFICHGNPANIELEPKSSTRTPDRMKMGDSAYRSAIESEPDDVENLASYAEVLEDKKNELTEADCQRAIEADPNDASSLTNYAEFLAEEKNELEEAEAYYLRAIEANPNNAYSLGSYAEFLDQKNELERAEAYYLRAIEADPNNIYNLGSYAEFLDEEKNDLEEAEAYYLRAIEANNTVPGSISWTFSKLASIGRDGRPRPLFYYTYILTRYALFLEEKKNDLIQAEVHYLRAIETNPNDTYSLKRYALFLENRKNDLIQAEVHYLRATEADPNDPDSLYWYAYFLEEKKNDVEQAGAYYQRVIEADPNNPDNLARYAIFLEEKKNDVEQAGAYYLRAIEADPDDSDSLTNYALFLAEKKNDLEQAEAHHLRATEADPNNPNSLTSYALFLEEKKNDLQQAEAYYLRAIEADPNNSYSLGRYATYLCFWGPKRNGAALAKSLIERAEIAEPDSTDWYWAIYWQHVENNLTEAEKYYRNALKVDTSDANTLSNLAGILFVQGNDEEASQLLQDSLEESKKNLDEVQILESRFYQYTHGDLENRQAALDEILGLLQKGIWSNWPFEPNIERAKTMNHPDVKLLELLDRAIHRKIEIEEVMAHIHLTSCDNG